VTSKIHPDKGGPTKEPIPCTSKINPYANVKSSISTSLLVIIGVNEKELPNVIPNIAQRVIRKV
jgi:hypothetical protein